VSTVSPEENENIEEAQVDEISTDSLEDDLLADAQAAAEEIEKLSHKHSEEEVKTETKSEVKQETPKVESFGDAQKTMVSLKEELTVKDNQMKRLAADFDNFRRRQTQEKEDLLKYGHKDFVLSLLSVVDNFERAMASSKDAQDISSVISGIELIQKQLFDTLNKNGVEYIEALDNQFDPNFHEAVQQLVDDNKPDQTVIHELQKGYALNGRVIRPSMVVVSTVS
jgi:molecular chaperone GrpE